MTKYGHLYEFNEIIEEIRKIEKDLSFTKDCDVFIGRVRMEW